MHTYFGGGPGLLRRERRLCGVCGTMFVPIQHNQKYCSPACRQWIQNNYYQCRPPMPQRYCDICGDPFTPTNWNHKRCSPKCAQEVTDLREQAERLPSLPPIHCDVCGIEFIPVNWNHKRCSSECARKMADARGRWIIFNRDNFQCIYCGKSAYGDRTQLHVEHIIPRDSGGEDTASNLATSCIRCNREKSTTMIFNPSLILDEVAKRNTATGVYPEMVIKA